MGKLYILGGIIVKTTFTAAGSQIEAVHVPVDSYGYFKGRGRSEGRFLAFLPKASGMLDPEIYTRGRRVTLAGEFVATRNGKIDETEYTYPVFQIKQVHLWTRERIYPAYYYDPWFYPFPYFYGGPWWSYEFFEPAGPLPRGGRTAPPRTRTEREPERERR